MINNSIKSRIPLLMSEILRQEGILKSGYVAEIVTPSPSSFVVESSLGDKNYLIMARVLSRMNRQRSRMESLIHNANLDLEKIKSWHTIPKFRYVGRKTYIELAQALIAEGVECGWAKALIFLEGDMQSEKRIQLSSRGQ